MAYFSQVMPVTFANGATRSSPFSLQSLALCGLFGLPAFDGTTLGFEVSPDGGTTWQLLEDPTGSAIVVNVTVNEARYVTPSKVLGWPAIRLVADTAQTADRKVMLLVREV